MKVLVVGSGGREHAIVWRLSSSPKVTKIYCAPGNAGIAELAECVPIATEDLSGLAEFARSRSIDLTIVGNETPLVAGIVDEFQKAGLTIFGPTAAAARVEGSKKFLKDFLKRHAIPTAGYASFRPSEQQRAIEHIRSTPGPYVIKTDGLAAGKGVSIVATADEAIAVLKEYVEQKIFGDAGTTVVIEEFMKGEEASIFALCDGEQYVLLSPAQDHKRIGDGDTGKNTGGMGAYAPAPVVTSQIVERVEREIIRPTLRGMAAEGFPYTGCLYVGLMITDAGPKVVEYNCRLGDPETQVVMPLIDSDPYDLFAACATGTLASYTLLLKSDSAVCVVIASGGYPDGYEKGKHITGLDAAKKKGAVVFHAGTKKEQENYVTAGGRVFGVTAIGSGLKETIRSAYDAVRAISFDGAYFRTDIGKKGLKE